MPIVEHPRDILDLTDEQILGNCDVHTYRASGPGGQKRNKTSSAVRLHHRPTGLVAMAEESRSQHENRARALRRLRETAAIHHRREPPARIVWSQLAPNGAAGPPPIAQGRLAVNRRNPRWPGVAALVLDCLAAERGRLSHAAERLGVTGSSVTALLGEHKAAWAEANRIRHENGLSPLKRPR